MKNIIKITLSLFISSYSLAQTDGFVKIVEDQTDLNLTGHCIEQEIPGGNLYIAGSSGHNVLIIEMAPDGTVINKTSLPITSGHDIVTDIVVDNGSIYACGHNLDHRQLGFVFSFNISSFSLNWIHTKDDIDASFYFRAIEFKETDPSHFYVFGYMKDHTDGGGGGDVKLALSTTRAMYFEIDNAGNAILPSGAVGDVFIFDHNSLSDDWVAGVNINGKSSILGSLILDDGNEAGRRVSVTGIDHSIPVTNPLPDPIDNFKVYFENDATRRRMYGRDICRVNTSNELAVIGIGTDIIPSQQDPETAQTYFSYLTRIDHSDGTTIDNTFKSLDQTRYQISSGDGEDLRFIEVEYYSENSTDKLLVIGTLDGFQTGSDHFIASINKNSHVVEWSRKFDAGGDETLSGNYNSQIAIDETNGFIYFVGETNSYGTTHTDMMIYKVPLSDGQINGACSTPLTIFDYQIDVELDKTYIEKENLDFDIETSLPLPVQSSNNDYKACYCESEGF